MLCKNAGACALRLARKAVLPILVSWLCVGGCTAPIDVLLHASPPGSTHAPVAELYRGGGDPYQPGPLHVRRIDVPMAPDGPPVPLLVFAPQPDFVYAAMVWQHGFMSRPDSYTRLLRHIASHGFVVVAPAMYEPGIGPLFGDPSAVAEAREGGAVLAWLREHLETAAQVQIDPSRLGLAGHSRGGKVSWLMAENDLEAIAALAEVDPVDGSPFSSEPRALQRSALEGMPKLVIGGGRSGSCAPAGDNYVAFYDTALPPAWQVLVPGMGHVDVFDDGPRLELVSGVCGRGVDAPAARRLIAGLLVTFFRNTLQLDPAEPEFSPAADGAPLPFMLEAKQPFP